MIAGAPGTILGTTDGGTSWSSLRENTSEYFYDVALIGPDTAIVVGIPFAAGPQLVLRTTTAGITWDTITTGRTEPLGEMSFIDLTGKCVGLDGIIMGTTDGGGSWYSESSGTTNSLFGIKLTTSNSGTAVGDNGTILNTTDVGNAWISQAGGTTLPLSGVSFSDKNNGTIVGYVGTILRTTHSGITFVEENNLGIIPGKPLLAQNYPNPFNPATKIKYSVPQSSNVIIKIFDVLGKEIETLTTGEKAAGTYELTWNAAGLPSGVYFYQFRSGSFVEMKKMMLLR